MHLVLGSIGNLFGIDGVIILAIGLLIFGRRLPEVANNISKIMRAAPQLLREISNPLKDTMFVIGTLLIIAAMLLAYLLGRGHW